MTLKQSILDRVRVMNKRFTNRVLIHICGKKFGHFAILGHTGRRTGALYRIPVIAEPTENGFMFALTYGKKVDWYRNVAAAGGCTLTWKEQEFQLTRPTLVPPEVGLKAFPGLVCSALKVAGIEYFLRLERAG